MPEKRSAIIIVDRAVWEKITERRGGIRWDDNVVEKIWEGLGDQEEVLPIQRQVERQSVELRQG